mmetsp:Transcript_22771/g.63309  ORF Transcript_22771/g.63309 Transcript_22771/m.63309 type:complete len:395 (+) Transcript_22771:113-1297(+)
MAAGMTEREDDEDVLDISEQTNRPLDDALHQQRVQAWHPILDPVWVIVALFYLGVILVPTGYKIHSLQDDVVELRRTYDDYDPDEGTVLSCPIGDNFNANKTCNLDFYAPKDMEPPILVYYELTNFHQNHRAYVQSRDDFELNGEGSDASQKKKCDPLRVLGDMTLSPCGLIANTFFNDIFKLVGGVDANGFDLEMSEEGIAWQSDIDYMFNQPKGFRYEECPESTDCSDENNTCCDGDEWSCGKKGTPWVDPKDGKCYRYYYPNEDTTQYLYETYEDIINPIEGVTNEHFIVWMRVALQPSFRKLYGWIDQPIKKGTKLSFAITANYVVTRFRGSKSIIITTNSIFGGRNIYFGPIFYVVGYFCLIAGTFFAVKHIFRPRKLADPAYLHFKTD